MGKTTKKEEAGWGYESYRDSLSTVDVEGKRVWVYAKKFTGKWFKRRAWLGYSLLVFLVTAPFLKINGRQSILLDVVHRKFIIFGNVFWPQDFFLFLVAIITGIVSIFLFTSIFGRLWCGWACPQTIFMEFIFRRIEYLIEGDAPAQRKLDKMEWNWEKTWKKGTKHFIFFAISFLIANIFLSYIIGSEELLKIMTESPANHLGGLAAITVFSGVFYFVFSYLREQVCTVVCPYGRLQSVLIDDNSLVVAYDYKRGDPREKWGRSRSDEAGDCINCQQCVEVCPTGIDIRNGIQLECINCNACIDACNSVMHKIGKAENLITLASMQGIEKKEKFRMTTRRVLYSSLLTVLFGGLVTLLSFRSDVQATILRTPGMSYSETQNGKIQNIYNIKVLNKTFHNMPVELKLENVKGEISYIGNKISAPAEEYGEGIITIEIDKHQLSERNIKLKIGVYSGDKKLQTVKTNFMAPDETILGSM